jgi:hypothetical protein
MEAIKGIATARADQGEEKKMEGTEKQVMWAEEIREKNISTLKKEIASLKFSNEYYKTNDFEFIIRNLEKALSDIESADLSAKYWIDHKGLAETFIQKIKDTDQKRQNNL